MKINFIKKIINLLNRIFFKLKGYEAGFGKKNF